MVTPVHVLGVKTINVVHHVRDIGARRVHHQMKVVAHQAISEALCAKLHESDRENHQEPRSIGVVDEDRLLAIAARHDVIDGAAEYDSISSGHARVDTNRRPGANARKSTQIARCRQSATKFLRRSRATDDAFFET
jgi:hypothetical protein